MFDDVGKAERWVEKQSRSYKECESLKQMQRNEEL